MRGQAFVAFGDQVAATTAMRSLGGETFYGKPLVRAFSHVVTSLRLSSHLYAFLSALLDNSYLVDQPIRMFDTGCSIRPIDSLSLYLD